MIARTAHAYRPAVAEVGTDHQGDDVRGFADLASLAPGHAVRDQPDNPATTYSLSFRFVSAFHYIIIAYRNEMQYNWCMSQTTAQQCAYPGCEQPVAPPTSDRGAKPKYCDDASHNPLNAHRERRKREADATGQRAEETGGQPVTIGLTRAAELVLKLESLTAQHTDALTRAIAELRSAGDVESAEAEVYAGFRVVP